MHHWSAQCATFLKITSSTYMHSTKIINSAMNTVGDSSPAQRNPQSTSNPVQHASTSFNANLHHRSHQCDPINDDVSKSACKAMKDSLKVSSSQLLNRNENTALLRVASCRCKVA